MNRLSTWDRVPRPPVYAMLFACCLVLAIGTGCFRRGSTGSGPEATPTNALTWSKTYGGAGIERATAMVESPGGGYLVAGVTDDFDAGATELWAFRVDGAGDSIWSRTYGRNGLRMHEVRSVAWEPSSSDVFVVGVELVGNTVEGVLVRMTRDFDVRWRRILAFTQPRHVLALPNGECMVTGATFEEGLATATRVDAEGNALWNVTLTAGTTWVSAVAPNGSIYVGGAATTSPGMGQPFVIALDPANGNPLWSQSEYDPGNGVMAVRGIEFAGTFGSYIALGTWILGDPEQVENGVFRQFGDAAGALVEHEDLQNAGSQLSGDISWNWLERLSDGTYIATGGAYTAGQPTIPVVGRFGATFDEIATRELAFPAPETGGAGTRIVEKANGNYVALGSINGLTRNVFYAEIDPMDAIVTQGITGAGSSGTIGTDVLNSAAFLSDGELCVAGQTDAGPNGLGAWIKRLGTSYQDVVEMYRRIDTVDDLRGAIINHAGDGFVLVGTTAASASGVGDTPCVFVLEIDDTGVVRWQRALRSSGTFAERGIGICAHGSGYAVLGQRGPDVTVTALDASGNTIETVRHTAPPFGNLRLTAGAIATAPGDQLFIAGTLGEPKAPAQEVKPLWIALLAPDLNQIWRFEYESPINLKVDFHPDFTVAGVQATANGCAVLDTVEIDDSVLLQPTIGILAVDAAGEPIWSKLFLGNESGEQAAALARGGDGTLTVAATTRSFGGGQLCDGVTVCPNMAVLRVDEMDGTIRWQKTYSTATSDLAHAVGVSATGDCWLAGETDGVLGNRDYWALRMDDQGEIADSCPAGIGVDASFLPVDRPFTRTAAAATEVFGPATDLSPQTAVIPRSAFQETRQCTGEGTDPTPIEFSVIVEVVGSGTVTSSTGENCTEFCEIFVAAGTTLELSTTPAAGWVFDGWNGDYTGAPLIVTADLTITATFAEVCPGGGIGFQVDEWTESWVGIPFAVTGTAFTASARVPTGGSPGAFRDTYFALFASESISVGHFAPEISYDSSVGSGAIGSIDFVIDYTAVTPIPAAATITLYFAVRQSNTIFIATSGGVAVNTVLWQSHTAPGLAAGAFIAPGGGTPNFAAGAPNIEFGYVFQATSPVALNHLVGVDSLSVTVNGPCP